MRVRTSDVFRVAPKLALGLIWQLFAFAGTMYCGTTEEGWEVSQILGVRVKQPRA